MLTPIERITRLSITAPLGGVLDSRREYEAKPAGLCTRLTMSLGAANDSRRVER